MQDESSEPLIKLTEIDAPHLNISSFFYFLFKQFQLSNFIKD
jgi:hypothetical protein